jgi:peptidyl-prolyl cis-trans isomerase D
MLKFFRRRDLMVRIMLGGFLVLVCVAMVMFLIPNAGTNDTTTPIYQQTVASVNGVAITGGDFTAELTRVEGGQSVPAQVLPMLGQEVLQTLVARQALADEAQKLGFTPTSNDIVEAAQQQVPQLYPDGKYVGDQQASQMISQMQMTLPEFEAQLRQSLMVNRVYGLITDPVRVSPAAVHQKFEKDNQKAVFDYVLLSPATLQGQIKVTPAQLAAYYKQHQAAYDSPERRKIEVVLANQAAIAAQIPVSNAAVHQYYEANIATYTHPEEVKVSHILLKYPDTNPTPVEIAATKARAEKVLKLVQANPKNFAALAKKYSQDDATASNGGELGFIQRNQTVANFEKVAFSLPVGQISGLVQTEYGFHIIKVEAHQQAYVQTEAQVHDQIVAALQRDQAADKTQSLINQAATMAQTTPLAQVAQKLGLEYFATAPISRTDPVTGIGVNPDFASAVFSTAAGGLTPPVQVAQGFALAKVQTVIPPGPQPLSAVQDAVTTDYKQAQAQALAVSEAGTLQKAAAKSGLKAAAAAMHLAVKTSPALTRSGSVPGVGAVSDIASTLFALKPGQVAPVTAEGGNQLVYQLVSLQQPTEADFLAQRASIEQSLLTDQRNQVFTAYTDALMQQLQKAGKINIDEAAYQRLLGAAAPAGAPAGPPPPSPLGLG